MTAYEQECAIAKALGWHYSYISKGACGGDVREDVWFPPGFPPETQTADWIAQNGHINPPRYTSDLNEIRAAVLTLEARHHSVYLDWLDVACGGELAASEMLDGPDLGFCLVMASAAQHAEALMRTLKIYNETP